MTLKVILPAVALLFAANQTMAQDEQNIVANDTLEATCNCVRDKLISVKALYTKNEKTSLIRHTISTGGVTVITDAIDNIKFKQKIGVKPRTKADKKTYKASKNNVPEAEQNVLDVFVAAGEKTCAEKRGGKHALTLTDEEKEKTISYFDALRLK